MTNEVLYELSRSYIATKNESYQRICFYYERSEV